MNPTVADSSAQKFRLPPAQELRRAGSATSPMHVQSAQPSIYQEQIYSANSAHTQFPFQNSVLFGRQALGLHFRRPLSLEINQDVDGIYVSDNEFCVYGHGANLAEAYRDYLSSFAEYYTLIEEQSQTDSNTRKLFHYLKSYVQRIN